MPVDEAARAAAQSGMTPYEMADLIFGLVGYGMTALALYFSVVSGYLVVAFMAGRDLTSSQVWFVNSLFTIFAVILAFGTYSFFRGAWEYGGGQGPIVSWLAPVLALAEVLGIVGALGFMVGVRRREAD